MRILLTNDDGIDSPGLHALRDIARGLSQDVWVVAPETNQSGASHSLSLHEPLRMRQVDDRAFAVRGTPTDSVIMGVRHLLKDKVPDLVLNCCIFGVLLGGRLGYCLFYQPSLLGFTSEFPYWGFLRVWDGGMSAHGGIVLARATVGNRGSSGSNNTALRLHGLHGFHGYRALGGTG